MTMTHEEMKKRALARRRFLEEEDEAENTMTTMTHEEMMSKAQRFIEEISWLITEDKAAYQEDPTHLVLVDDIDRVKEAYYDDLENGFEDEEEDIYGFLDRHGIEWQ